MNQGSLTIIVIKAILTKDVCIFKSMDPYFIGSISTHKSFKSSVRTSEGKFPMWNEKFCFTYLNEPSLIIEIFHSNTLVIQFPNLS